MSKKNKNNIIKGNEKKFYNSDLLFSHNLIFNFVLGARSNGKTYEGKKKAIRRFLKTGEQFIWLRRRSTDIKSTFFSFPDDIEHEFPNEEFKVVGNKLLINGKVAGRGYSLSGASRHKSVSFAKVWLIVYDEFLVSEVDSLNRNTGYLRGEAEQLLKFYDTVNRLKGTTLSSGIPVKVLLIANAESQYNPFFDHFGINLSEDHYRDGEVLRVNTEKHGTVAVQRFVSPELQKARSESQFGSMIKNTAYGKHSLNNEFYMDNDEFIVKNLPPNLKPVCSITYDGTRIGFWYDEKNFTIYGTRKYQTTVPEYVFNVNEHTEHTILLQNRANYKLQTLLKAWRNGALKYDSLIAKKHTETIFHRQG